MFKKLFGGKRKDSKASLPGGASSGATESASSCIRTAARIDDLYTIQQELGTGGFAVVKKGVDKDDKSVWAVKMIRNNVFKKNKEQTEAEVNVLQKLDHPNIVKLREVVRTDKYFCIVMELLGGGELFDRIVEREKYTEDDAKDVARQILEAIRYVHSKNVVHRDLKPENILFVGDTLKITDFGFAAIYDKRVGLTQSCGTPEYVAPEILDEAGRPYTNLVDMWSAGVIMYILLCGFPPFYGDSDDELFTKISDIDFDFPAPYWDPVSATAKDLIRKLLTTSDKRLSAEQALKHEWFKTKGPQTNAPVLSGALSELHRYQATMKLRYGVMAVVAAYKFTTLAQK